MSGWQNSHSIDGKHEHVPRMESTGREVCITCGQIVTKPILSSDDDRLVDAGLHRSNRLEVDPITWPMSLPEQLVWMYDNVQAPVAPYLLIVFEEHSIRGTIIDGEFWKHMSNKF